MIKTMTVQVKGRNYPGSDGERAERDRARNIRTRYHDRRNVPPDPRGPRTFTRHLTRPVSSMPSVISSGSPTGPTKGMHPLARRNPAKYSRKMSISDVGMGGEGKVRVYAPTKPSLIAGVIEKLPALADFAVERVRMARESLRDILWGGSQ